MTLTIYILRIEQVVIKDSTNIIEWDSNNNAWIKPKHKHQSRPPTILDITLKFLIAQNQMQVPKLQN